MGTSRTSSPRSANTNHWHSNQRLNHVAGWRDRSAQLTAFLQSLLQREALHRPEAKVAVRDPWCTKHKPVHLGLTHQMLQSLSNYVDAPPPVRSCLLAIAVRTAATDRQDLSSAFLSADVDGDGTISEEDLAIALERSRGWWSSNVDFASTLHLASLEYGKGLSFSEFVAACLYDEQGSLEQLAQNAFTAFDDDRDGLLWARDLCVLFPDLETYVLKQLPRNRPFDCKDWSQAFVDSCLSLGGAQPTEVRDVDAVSCAADMLWLRCGEIKEAQGTCGVEVATCAQQPALSTLDGCHKLLREISNDSEEAPQYIRADSPKRSFDAFPARPRRLKKGVVDCWGLPCAGDD